jgi:hypothetical protein
MGAIVKSRKRFLATQADAAAAIEISATEIALELAGLGGSLLAGGPVGALAYGLSKVDAPAVARGIELSSDVVGAVTDVLQTELSREAKNEQAGIKRAIEEMKGDLQGVRMELAALVRVTEGQRQEVANLAIACDELRKCVCELKTELADFFDRTVLAVSVRDPNLGRRTHSGLGDYDTHRRLGAILWKTSEGAVVARDWINYSSETKISPYASASEFELADFHATRRGPNIDVKVIHKAKKRKKSAGDGGLKTN